MEEPSKNLLKSNESKNNPESASFTESEIISVAENLKVPSKRKRKSMKSDTKDHKCPYCNNSFSGRGSLYAHIQQNHEGKLEKTDALNSIFPYLENSKSNIGNKPAIDSKLNTPSSNEEKSTKISTRFHCTHCGSDYAQKTELDSHVKEKHEAKLVVRKRKPINFTLDDLNDDEDKDEIGQVHLNPNCPKVS